MSMRKNVNRRRIATVLLVGTLTLTSAACGGGDDDDAGSGDAASETDMGDGSEMGSEMDMEEHGDFAFGEPADAADADRTIEIEAKDELAFDPPAVEVQVGETITFVVTNTGQNIHSFVLGDEDAQAEHEAEMQEMAGSDGAMAHDEPNTLEIPPGETAELTWHFTSAGEVLYGCHQPAHYDAGMVGTITVTG